MHIEIWPIRWLIPYEKNARIIPQAAIDKVAASLKEFGWQQPIVADKHGVIIVGHVRRLGALELGWEKCPVYVARDLTAKQVKQYRLMDNRSHEEASWDDRLLKFDLGELEPLDLGLTGFDLPEIDLLLGAPDIEPDTWQEHWKDMPEFENQNLEPKFSVHVQFLNEADRDAFAKLIGQPMTYREIWYPEQKRRKFADKRWVAEPEAPGLHSQQGTRAIPLD